MACSVGDCEAIIEQADKKKVRLAVNHARRFDPAYLWVREQFRSGRLGTPRAMWIQRPGIGLGYLGVHSFDLVNYFTGLSVDGVQAWIDKPVGPNPRGEQFVDPGGQVLLHCGPDFRATVVQIEDGAGPMSIEMDFTKARVRMDDWSGDVEIIERDRSVKPGPNRPPAFQRCHLPEHLRAKPDMGSCWRACSRYAGRRPNGIGWPAGPGHHRNPDGGLRVATPSHSVINPQSLAAEDRARCLSVT